MKKFYSIRKSVEKANVFDRVGKVLSGYGLSIIYDGRLTATIHRREEKVGYVWLGPAELMVEIYPAFESVVDWSEVLNELLRFFEKEGFLRTPAPIPKAPPVEVYHHGRFAGTVNTRPEEPGLTSGEIVKLAQQEFRRKGCS